MPLVWDDRASVIYCQLAKEFARIAGNIGANWQSIVHDLLFSGDMFFAAV